MWFLFALLLGIVVYACLPQEIPVELVIAWVGGAWAITHFLHQHELEKNRFFFDLFNKFNERYDNLNNDLQDIFKTEAPLTDEQRVFVIDYFNLCAEEYFFYSRGYIPHDVWHSWRKGMNAFAGNENFKALWKEEMATGSYYGFDFNGRN
jgi:hypothetical protein